MINKIELDNGLRVVIEKIPFVRSVSIGIWVKTGTRQELPEQNGISHFIEHLLFKGTSRRSARDIAEAFDGIGGNVNAFTSKEYTCYYAKVLDEHLPVAVDVLSDMFFNSLFDAEEVRKEKNVVIEEIRMVEDTPDDLVHDLLSEAAYSGHSLGYSILGTEKVLNELNPEQIRAYLSTHYTPENTVIAIAGNVDDNVLELVKQYFGHFNTQASSRSLVAPTFQPNTIYRKKTTEQSHVCLGLPGLAIQDHLLYPLILMNNILGGSMSSRLFQEIREKRGWAYSVYSYHSSHIDSGLFAIYAGTSPKQAGDVLKLINEILAELKDNGLSESEIKKSKDQLKGSLMLGLESTNSRMSRIGKNELMLRKHPTLDDIVGHIDAVTTEEINQMCRQLFGNPFAISMVGPSDEPLKQLGGK